MKNLFFFYFFFCSTGEWGTAPAVGYLDEGALDRKRLRTTGVDEPADDDDDVEYGTRTPRGAGTCQHARRPIKPATDTSGYRGRTNIRPSFTARCRCR